MLSHELANELFCVNIIKNKIHHFVKDVGSRVWSTLISVIR
jgi:hypothetical protein